MSFISSGIFWKEFFRKASYKIYSITATVAVNNPAGWNLLLFYLMPAAVKKYSNVLVYIALLTLVLINIIRNVNRFLFSLV